MTRKVLIVDDNAEDRRSLTRHLSRDPAHAYEIWEASTGPEGIDAIVDAQPDVLLLDEHLGESTSSEVLQTIRARGYSHIPVVLLTGGRDGAPRATPLELGADDFLSKEEISARHLRRTIDNAIIRAKARFELERSCAELTEALAEVTQRMEFERKLIGVVSHDLRDPLSAMSMAVETLKRAELEPHEERVLSILERTTSHMSAMVTQLLDVTRLRGNGVYPLKFEEVDLDALVEDRVESLRAARKCAAIETVAGRGNGIQADASALRRAIDNLVGNAVRHGDPATPISVRVVQRDGTAEISVTNAGEPIPAERLPTLFEPFTQGTNPHRDGLGLGLYITREIATAHGGTLEVESDESRTCFTLRVPSHQA